MSLAVSVTHRVTRRFAHRVSLATHWLRLRPAPHTRAHVSAYSLRVLTEPHFLNWARDPFENHLARLDLPEPVPDLTVEVALLAELRITDPFDFLVEPHAHEHPFAYEPQLAKELGPYLRIDGAGARLAPWLAGLERGSRYVVDRVGALNVLVHQHLASAAGDGAIDLEAALARRCGTPRDLAWLLTLSLRALGLAARFTSGYRIVAADGDSTAGASLHAWSEVYLPGAGWIGLDPSAGLFVTEAYVPLASAPDPLRTEPVVGTRAPCDEERTETIDARIISPVAPSWPYSERDWAGIGRVAATVDRDLRAAGVRLALGRELAFVPAGEAWAPEWTTATPGPTRRHVAGAFMAVLRERLAADGVVQESTGQQFAGEPLPRWRLCCVHRLDGAPVWRRGDLLEAPACVGDKPPLATARRFAEALVHRLGLPPNALVTAYEDPLHRLWREAQDTIAAPSADDLRDPAHRRRLADELSLAAPTIPAGHVLPLAWDWASDGWRSGAWTFRRGRLYLLPGTSPMGYRLPLESLRTLQEPPADDADCPRTALCVEVRDGRVCVFVPPLRDAEHYLALVAAIEETATALTQPVALEGYGPPADPRLHQIVLEPAPGVLMLSLPLAEGFDGQLAMLRTAYDEATRVGLRAEHVRADGTRAPLGASGALLLGGPTPDESPLGRRPEILRGLVVHWQRHPSLSYFFATRAIGPGGLAPRPDEGRADALYELAIALERIPAGEYPRPWLPDRLLRHLLASPDGDIRRAELCMDRLFDPATPDGRLGQLALRGWETPPCAEMAALQALLVAAVVALLARNPRVAAFERFGRALHDEFLLPTVLRHDLRTLLHDLDRAGYAFEPGWFAPFLDLLFPLHGRVQAGDIALELRTAHEPWPLLAEEVTPTGTARFVDSANERLEVRATGLTPARHVLVCNGRRVPLRTTGTEGEFVAGVRYKTWSPPATLHPTTRPVGELVFDLIDTRTGRAIAGCRFVPSPPAPVGPTAPVAVSDDGDPRGVAAPRALPSYFVPWSPRSGRFLPEGSASAPPAPRAEELVPGHVLDLTDPA